MKGLGLYFHIPFCVSKCGYCDFYSLPQTDALFRQKYVHALINHMREYSVQTKGYTVTSVYFGGGTPTLLENEQIKLLMKNIKKYFSLSDNCEISMEANPGTADYEKFRVMRKSGINRLSLGVQSFNDAILSACGRIHTCDDVYAAVTAARKAGFENISIDLMFGLPGQTKADLLESLKRAFELEVEHISLYGLKIEEGTPFWEQRKLLALPDEDSESDMYFTAVGFMKQNGYMQYEISNFARKNHVCRHNLRYWNADEYIGFGAAAHSYFAGKRFSFKKNAKLYTDALCSENAAAESIIDEYIDIPPSARIAEYVMLRFRLNKGIDKEKFKMRFGRDFDSVYYNRLRPFIQSGHIAETPKGYAFSPGGMYVSNYILSRVVDFDLVIPGLDQ